LEKLSPAAEADRERAMRELQRLTPEQREKVWKAVMAVMNLPEDQQTKLIYSEDERRKKAREEIDQKLKELGIPDEKDKKWPFIRAYFHGRRKIEEKLRAESDERRTVLMSELHEKLKNDFGPNAAQQATQQVVPAPESQPK
jgi:hypothetical protein